jgi:hypothetical protein
MAQVAWLLFMFLTPSSARDGYSETLLLLKIGRRTATTSGLERACALVY